MANHLLDLEFCMLVVFTSYVQESVSTNRAQRKSGTHAKTRHVSFASKKRHTSLKAPGSMGPFVTFYNATNWGLPLFVAEVPVDLLEFGEGPTRSKSHPLTRATKPPPADQAPGGLAPHAK